MDGEAFCMGISWWKVVLPLQAGSEFGMFKALCEFSGFGR